jgi:hypothetical protein
MDDGSTSMTGSAEPAAASRSAIARTSSCLVARLRRADLLAKNAKLRADSKIRVSANRVHGP